MSCAPCEPSLQHVRHFGKNRFGNRDLNCARHFKQSRRVAARIVQRGNNDGGIGRDAGTQRPRFSRRASSTRAGTSSSLMPKRSVRRAAALVILRHLRSPAYREDARSLCPALLVRFRMFILRAALRRSWKRRPVGANRARVRSVANSRSRGIRLTDRAEGPSFCATRESRGAHPRRMRS